MEERAYLTVEDLQERYGVGLRKAQALMQSIKIQLGGGVLGKGRLLRTELAHWEAMAGEGAAPAYTYTNA